MLVTNLRLQISLKLPLEGPEHVQDGQQIVLACGRKSRLDSSHLVSLHEVTLFLSYCLKGKVGRQSCFLGPQVVGRQYGDCRFCHRAWVRPGGIALFRVSMHSLSARRAADSKPQIRTPVSGAPNCLVFFHFPAILKTYARLPLMQMRFRLHLTA